jgi:3-phosphoglycerate kinase
VFWDGLVGVAECSAAQAGSRAITSSLMNQHDNTGAVVLVNGGATGTWARLFGNLDPIPDNEGVRAPTYPQRWEGGAMGQGG